MSKNPNTQAPVLTGKVLPPERTPVNRRVHDTAIRLRRFPDTGATTAEYAMTTLAACGFAALLIIILKSPEVREALSAVILKALGL